MRTQPILLLAGDAGWLPVPTRAVGRGDDGPRGTEVDSVAIDADDFLTDADEVIATIRRLAGTGDAGLPSVVIGLASHRCFAARVSTAGLPARQLRQALPFRFEAAVPFAVEDLVLDAHGQGDERLVVATHPEPLGSMVHGLEDAGVRVCGVAPLALLAAQSAGLDAKRHEPASGGAVYTIAEPSALCAAQVPSASEVVCPSTKTRSTTVGPGTKSGSEGGAMGHPGAGGHSGGVGHSGGGGVMAWRWLPGAASAADDAQLAVAETLRLAHATVRRVVLEEDTLWINLQQGPLASRHRLERVRRPLVACVAAAALLLVASIGAMQARAWQYREAATAYDTEARLLYQDAFPGEDVPVNMERRLTTRLRELRGRQGLATPDVRLFAEANTLVILRDLLARLPGETRLVITDLRLSGDRIDVVGQARSHSDADTLAAALRADSRFDVTPPSTENLPNQGVQFTLHLTPTTGPRPWNRDGGNTGSLVSEQVRATTPGDGAAVPRRPDGGTP